MKEKIPTYKLIRQLPEWAKIVTIENDIPIYNMSILDNIMSWNMNNLDVPAIDYCGNIITYGQLPEKVRNYVNGFRLLGITDEDIVTLCMPVSVENMLSLFAINNIGAISNNPNFLFLRNDFDTYTKKQNSKTLVILDKYLPFVIDSLEKSNIKNVINTCLEDYLPQSTNKIFQDLSSLQKKWQKYFVMTVKKKNAKRK